MMQGMRIPLLGALGRGIKNVFSLDYRSVALLRIGIGATLLFDIINRARDLVAHYSDEGVLPRGELLRLWSTDWVNSLHIISGYWQVQAVLFIVAGVFALMLIAGYRTRVAIIASWILLMSIHARNPVILQGGDIILRVIVFWMMFLPIGRVYSLDRLLSRVPRVTEKTFFSSASFAYIIQIAAVYFFSAVLKTGVEWHAEGSAVYYALNIDQFAVGLGLWIREFPGLMRFMTHFVYYIELVAPLLLFIPWKRAFFRTVTVLAIIGIQVGFNVSMRLGLFGMIGVVTVFGLIPSAFWDRIFPAISKKISSKARAGLIIYYDFKCSFCHKASFLLRRVLLLGKGTKVLPVFLDPESEKLMQEKDSWVVMGSDGVRHVGWDGVCTVVAHSPYLFWTAPILRISFIARIGERVYRYVANRRLKVCIVEPTEEVPVGKKKSFKTLTNVVVLALLVYGMLWNIEGLKNGPKVPNELDFVAQATRLDQRFNMFAPRPLTEDGWYIMPGTLRDGTNIDVYTGEFVTFDKPKSVAHTYKNQRWQKYMMNLWNSTYREYRLGYGRYLCRNWNKHAVKDKELMTYEIIFMLEKTPKPGEPQSPVEQRSVWSHQCF